MFPRGHAGFIMAIYAVSVNILNPTDPLIIAVGLPVAVIMSILPDIDISNKLILSKLEHRGITHTVWFSVFVGLMFYCFLLLSEYMIPLKGKSAIFLSSMAFIGYASHLILDMFNERGIRPIYARGYLSTDIRLGVSLVESDNARFNYGLLVIGCLTYMVLVIVPSLIESVAENPWL
jgi:inner membrane protein